MNLWLSAQLCSCDPHWHIQIMSAITNVLSQLVDICHVQIASGTVSIFCHSGVDFGSSLTHPTSSKVDKLGEVNFSWSQLQNSTIVAVFVFISLYFLFSSDFFGRLFSKAWSRLLLYKLLNPGQNLHLCQQQTRPQQRYHEGGVLLQHTLPPVQHRCIRVLFGQSNMQLFFFSFQVLRQHYAAQYPDEAARNRYPILMLSFTVSPSAVDVNLTPDKTQVLLQDKVCFKACLLSRQTNWACQWVFLLLLVIRRLYWLPWTHFWFPCMASGLLMSLRLSGCSALRHRPRRLRKTTVSSKTLQQSGPMLRWTARPRTAARLPR